MFVFVFSLVSTITSADSCQMSDRQSATCFFYYLQTYIFIAGNTEMRQSTLILVIEYTWSLHHQSCWPKTEHQKPQLQGLNSLFYPSIPLQTVFDFAWALDFEQPPFTSAHLSLKAWCRHLIVLIVWICLGLKIT